MKTFLTLFFEKLTGRSMIRLYRILVMSIISSFIVAAMEFVGLPSWNIDPQIRAYILGILTALQAAIDKWIRDNGGYAEMFGFGKNNV